MDNNSDNNGDSNSDNNSWFWKIQRGEMSPPKIVQTLGGEMTCRDAESGELEARFHVGEEFTNPAGNIQGGIIAAMLDAAMGHAVAIILQEKQFAPTLNLNVSFIKAAWPGTFVSKGQVIRKGGSVGYLEAELFDEDGELLATATSTVKIANTK